MRIHIALKLDGVIFVVRLHRNLHRSKFPGNDVALQIVVERSAIVGFPNYAFAMLPIAKTQVRAVTNLLHQSKCNLVHGSDMLLVRVIF